MNMKGKVLLERALSKLGLASRGNARQWILEGRLRVNGEIVKDPLFLVVPEKTHFALDGKVLIPKRAALILLYKTKGVVTTCSDEKGRKTVYDLLPQNLHHMHPVGRLDMYTTGLLLLTNDTKLSSYLTNPDHKIRRVYLVSVRGELTQEEVDQLIMGVEDSGDLLQAEEIQIRKVSGRESHLTVTLVAGKNREIRRMFQVFNHEVTALKRIAFGPFLLDDLPLGKWREFPMEELPKAFPFFRG
jgi:23S rRNA pseudouridine2605 synthase